MEVNLQLTQRLPVTGKTLSTMDIGHVWTGHHKADKLPEAIVFGALVELRVMPDEDHRDVDVSLHYSQAMLDPPEFAMLPKASRTVTVWNPLDVPDSIYCPFQVEMEIVVEGALFVWVALDGEIERRSYRPVVVSRG